MSASVPGWYADPTDPNQLSYWDGKRWTGQHRPLPTWTDRQAKRGGRGRPPIAGHGRRQWIVIAGAALLVMGLAYAALPRSGSDGPKVLTDASFIAAANQRCQATLNGLRPPLVNPDPLGDAKKGPSNTQQADAADRAADGLLGLADQLRSLPAAPADQPHIAAWLDDWVQFAQVGHRVAAALRSNKPADANKVGRDGDPFQHRADRFARANGIKKCQFFIVPAATGSDPFSGG